MTNRCRLWALSLVPVTLGIAGAQGSAGGPLRCGAGLQAPGSPEPWRAFSARPSCTVSFSVGTDYVMARLLEAKVDVAGFEADVAGFVETLLYRETVFRPPLPPEGDPTRGAPEPDYRLVIELVKTKVEAEGVTLRKTVYRVRLDDVARPFVELRHPDTRHADAQTHLVFDLWENSHEEKRTYEGIVCDIKSTLQDMINKHSDRFFTECVSFVPLGVGSGETVAEAEYVTLPFRLGDLGAVEGTFLHLSEHDGGLEFYRVEEARAVDDLTRGRSLSGHPSGRFTTQAVFAYAPFTPLSSVVEFSSPPDVR